MTREHLLRTWEELGRQAAEPNVGAYLHLQLSAGAIPVGAILRVEDRRPGLLVRFPVADAQRIPKPDSGRGYLFERTVAVSTETLGLPILVADMAAQLIFAAMASDLITAVGEAAPGKSAVEIVLQRIALWRRFLQRRVALLTDEEVRGLVGELEVLGRVAAREDMDRALDAWRGPFGELQDFSFSDGMMEVKSCQPETGGRVHISEPGQLTLDPVRPMWLAVVRLSAAPSSGRTLPEIVGTMLSTMTEMQRQRFRELLAAYGYWACLEKMDSGFRPL